MAASVQLSYLLTHQLASDDSLSLAGSTEFVTRLVQTHKLISHVENEENNGEKDAQGVLHRWTLRLTSLITSNTNTKNKDITQSLGFSLAIITSRQSETLFLQNAQAWYNSAIGLLSSKKALPSSILLSSASEFLLLCFEKAQYLPEFAREVANPAGVRKFGDALLAIAVNEDTPMPSRLSALHSLTNLLGISASPLRPLAAQLQALSIHLLCKWTDSSYFFARKSAIQLLTSVHLSAGKAQAGQSWRRTIEALLGSASITLTGLVGTFVEEVGFTNLGLQSLDLPPLVSQSNSRGTQQAEAVLDPLLDRFEALVDALVYMLQTPTERAVPLPVGVLVQFSQRLLSITLHSPMRERVDQNLHTAQLGLLSRLHIQGSRILGQLVKCAGTYLTTYSSSLLSIISFVQSTYPSNSPSRLSFYGLTSLLCTSVPLHPDESSKSLNKIVRCLLEDVAVLLDENDNSRVQEKKETTQRKAKKARLTFETDQALNRGKIVNKDLVVGVVHALGSLHRILNSAASYILTPQMLNTTLRLLLSYSLHPQFFTILSSTSTIPSSTLLYSALSQSSTLRNSILNCLLATITNTSGVHAPAFLDHVLAVFRTGLTCLSSSDDDQDGSKDICERGLAQLQLALRPIVPPVIRTRAGKLGLLELSGGVLVGGRKAKDERSTEGQDGDHQENEDIQITRPALSTPGLAPIARESPFPVPAPAPTPKPIPTPTPAVKSLFAPTPTAPAPTSPAIQPIRQPTPPPNSIRPAAPPIERLEEEEGNRSQIISNQTVVPEVEAEPDQEGEVLSIAGEEDTSMPDAQPNMQKGDESDSDDDDDDAPMPKIYMSDDEADA